jgi:hypothetical protein
MTDITTTLKFLQWQELYKREKPFLCFVDIPEDAEDKRDNNLVFEDRETRITDIRPSKDQFTLDGNGLMMRNHRSSVSRSDTETIKEIYLTEVEELVKQSIDGVDEVFIFDWRVCYLCFCSAKESKFTEDPKSYDGTSRRRGVKSLISMTTRLGFAHCHMRTMVGLKIANTLFIHRPFGRSDRVICCWPDPGSAPAEG